MSENLHFFAAPHRCTVAALPFNLAERLEHWGALRREMVRQVSKAFTRDEWAYLASFLDQSTLRRPFLHTFGEEVKGADVRPDVLVRPRGTIAIWLPNTVSLLGPLTLILASLSGAPLWIKTGSRAEDLAAAFLDYARQHLPGGALARYLGEQVRIERIDRHSPINGQMAAAAKVRVVFGSDAAVAAIHQLPHPADSVAISFGDHCSEAWVELEALSDEDAMVLIRVFAIYGRAGCTSPRRVVVLGGSREDARALQQRLAQLWPKAVRSDVPMHLASMNIKECQLARAQGWEAGTTLRNAAVLVAGAPGLVESSGLMSLAAVPFTAAEAAAALPPNIQTIGHCLRDPQDPAWLELLARSAVKRFVPLSAMHHFGPVWDGSNYWSQFFEEVVLRV